MQKLLFVVCSLVALACQTAPPAQATPPAASTSGATVARDAQSPLEVTLRALSESATSATLEVRVRKATATERPLVLTLTLPPGVEAAPATLPPVEALDTGVQTRLVQLSFQQRPATDLFVVADLQGTAMGYHATVPYRFGRPEPVAPELPRSGAVHLGPHSLGQPVDLGAPGNGK